MRSSSTAGPRRSRSGSAERGFTLVEVAVALLVLGLSILGAVQATSGVLHVRNDLPRYAHASSLAEQKLHELALASPDSLSRHGRSAWREVRLPPHGYRWRTTVRPDPRSPGLWRVAAEVAWTEEVFRLETVLYRPRDRTPGSVTP